MPNPAEICVVTALGQKYQIWESVEVHKSTVESVINHALLTVSEISSKEATFATMKLKPGDPVQISLAGINVIDGWVYLRQAAFDKGMHTVQIGIASKSQIIMPSTVDGKPGQYKKQTAQQIISGCFGKVGVNFKIVGAPPGADKIFDRISEQIGETRFAFAERICRLRNLHMMDDGNGTIEGFRGPQGKAPTLQEGVNILRARLLLSNSESHSVLEGVANLYNPASGPQGADVNASASVPQPFGGTAQLGPFKFVVENAADKKDVQMRVDHGVDKDSYETVDGLATVQGWFASDNDLWINHVRKAVTLNSPMLLPGNSMDFVIKEVVHRQGPDGTTTDVLFTNMRGLGGSPLFGVEGSPPIPGAT